MMLGNGGTTPMGMDNVSTATGSSNPQTGYGQGGNANSTITPSQSSPGYDGQPGICIITEYCY